MSGADKGVEITLAGLEAQADQPGRYGLYMQDGQGRMMALSIAQHNARLMALHLLGLGEGFYSLHRSFQDLLALGPWRLQHCQIGMDRHQQVAAWLQLQGPEGLRELPMAPSDGIWTAMQQHAPVYTSASFFEQRAVSGLPEAMGGPAEPHAYTLAALQQLEQQYLHREAYEEAARVRLLMARKRGHV